MGTPTSSAVKTLLLVGIIAACAGLIVTGSYEVSHERIAANEREALLRELYSVLDPGLRDRGLAPTHFTVMDRELLGVDAPVDTTNTSTGASTPSSSRSTTVKCVGARPRSRKPGSKTL